MDSRMERHNSNVRNRDFNQTLNSIDLNLPYLPDGTEENGIDLNEWSSYTIGGISMSGTSHTVSDLASGITNTSLIQSESLSNNTRSSLQRQNLWHAPTTSFSQSTHFYGASRTVSDFVSGVTNIDLIPSERLPNNARSSLETQNLWHAPTTSFSQSTHFYGASRTVSDFVSGVTNTDLISSESLPNNSTSSLQMQNLWHAPTASFSQNTHFHEASRMTLMENSTHLTFIERHTDFHGGSSSSSRNQSNTFIQPSGGSMRYLRAHGLGDTGRDANFLINNFDPLPLSLVIGESVAVGTVRQPGHRDNPIVIEQNGPIATENLKSQDDEEDEHGDAQQDGIFYDGEISYEALLALQENIDGVGTRLNKSIISKSLKQSKYQSTKMKNYTDSCCICLGTYDDGEELKKIDCGHEFHRQCIRKWLKIKNSCPICRRIASTL